MDIVNSLSLTSKNGGNSCIDYKKPSGFQQKWVFFPRLFFSPVTTYLFDAVCGDFC